MIICCGESLIDMIETTLPEGGNGAEKMYRPVVGGSIFNTAVGIGRLGGVVEWLGGLSSDPFGHLITEELEKSKVGYEFALRSAKPTALAFVSVIDGEPHYRFYDVDSAGSSLEAVNMPDLPTGAEFFHFGGISLVTEPGGSAFESMMRRAAKKHIISFDPNIRPNFVEDVDRYKARMRRMLATSDIVKVSKQDLDWLMPGWEADTVARQFANMGVKIVLITQGADGVLAYQGNVKIHIPAEKKKVVDTVGAGDAFNAGVLYQLQNRGLTTRKQLKELSEIELTEIVTFANKVAGRSVARAGAGSPWMSELADL